MNNLGYYYEQQENYENMMKYYLMAIENENSFAMYYLGYYYEKQKNYENMKKYYLMALEHDHNMNLNRIIYLLEYITIHDKIIITNQKVQNTIFQNFNIIWNTGKALYLKEYLDKKKLENKTHMETNKYLLQCKRSEIKINCPIGECEICYEDMSLSIYVCNCTTDRKICLECFSKIVLCPLCRYEL
jgi:tetratricopeptide (TPR) repeat protein